MTIYLDSCLVIYLIESHPTFGEIVAHRLARQTNEDFTISDLTLMECLIAPLRSSDDLLERTYRQWLGNAGHLALTTAVYEKAAMFRAAHPSLKTPDALHLACAEVHSCDELWTNDKRFP